MTTNVNVVGRLDEVHIAVEDIANMRRYYTEVLGFKEEFYDVGWGAGLQTGGASLVLREVGERCFGLSLSLTCSRIEEILQSLGERGVTITEPLYEGHWGAKVAGFEDPEGNKIYLEEPISR